MRIVAHIVEGAQETFFAGYCCESHEVGRLFHSRDAARHWIEQEAEQLSARLMWEADNLSRSPERG